MAPVLVHGVDISALEGWMVKINSNPSVFGKSMNRRWFKVAYVPAGNEQKLIISYSSSKTSKEPRGWLYIEDVSGVYCRRDMIEVVSPARTLRFKGETTVEHRLWSDSLHRLCNPPKSTPEPQDDANRAALAKAEAQKAREREAQLACEQEAKQEREKEEYRAREREEQLARERDRDRIAAPKRTVEYVSSARERDAKMAQHDAREERPRRKSPSPERRPRRRDDSEDDSEGDNHRSDDSSEEDDEQPRRRQSMDPDRLRSSAENEATAPSRRHSANAHTNSRYETQANRRDSLGDSLGDSRRGSSTMDRPSPRRDSSRPQSGERERRRQERDDDDGKDNRRDDDDSDDDSSDDERQTQQKPRGVLEHRSSSFLVASIKSMSPCSTEPKPAVKSPASNSVPVSSKARVDAKQKEDDDSDEDEESPQQITPRDDDSEPRMQVSKSSTPEPARRQPSPERPKSKRNSAYFDDEDEEDGQDTLHHEEETNNKHRGSVSQPIQAPKASAPVSEVRADNNFVDDDWDAPDNSTPMPTKHGNKSPAKRVAPGFGGVASDANFATEDWDD
ncbi:hypothetical protein Poli38472_004389 [Pythium oligandrum]|uniref:PH domain-containing protein n=1 Tax=Pythium oligandrum TaxID=41045 RepID=A0A8K1CA53_PYTOL|nr:hypothetical protein Poli38472_004389 [Pythium oligandrum]|eukprot:TMW59320.1 hypothetical protein Poli38472_004389 [Pythium oligandrum]